MRILRTLLAIAAAAGAPALPLTAIAPATAAIAPAAPSVSLPATTVPTPDPTGVTVTVVAGASGIHRPGADLALAARISNDTEVALPEGTASVEIDPDPIGSRSELSEWLLPTDAATVESVDGGGVIEAPTPAIVPGGAGSLPGQFAVPAASVPLGATFAVHRIEVTVVAGETRAVGRAAIVVDPGTGTPSTRLAVALPLAPAADTPGVIPLELLESYTAPGGRLDRVLQQTEGTNVALGIDPRIIASINLLGDTAPPSVLAWRDRLSEVTNDTFPLAYADSDVAATSQVAGSVLSPLAFDIDPELFTTEEPSPAPTPAPVPGEPTIPTTESLLAWDYSTSGIAWPNDDTVVGTDLDTFATAGFTTTILSSTNSTASTRATTPAASGTTAGHGVLTSDAVLSDLLRTAVSASTPTESQAAIAGVTASLAAIAGESAPGQVVLATLGREAATGSFALESTLAAVTAPPWVTPDTLSAAAAQPPVEVTVVDRPVDADRAAAVASMLASEGAVAQFASTIDDPVQITGERRLDLLAMTSQEWRAFPDDWPAAVADYLAVSTDILGSVMVASTEFQQFSDNRPLPVVITNALDYPVTVNVTVTSLSAILAIEQPVVELTIPANSQERASIPAQSIANGRATLQIALSSLTGVPIGVPSTIAVTVNAGWETAVTTVLAVLVVAVFVLGIIRTVRRRRRLARGGDDATDAGTPPAAEAG